MNPQRQIHWFWTAETVFGWIWLLSVPATLWFFSTSLFTDAPWSRFWWSAFIGVIAQWLSGGFAENKQRVMYEVALAQEEASTS